jgi:hypothetical protein
MFVELTKSERYRGIDREPGEIIECSGALGDRLVLGGHKRSTASAFEAQRKGIELLSDEAIDALDYKDLQALVKEHEVESEGKSADDYKAALKAFYASKREGQ